jgi:hypothetical protein
LDDIQVVVDDYQRGIHGDPSSKPGWEGYGTRAGDEGRLRREVASASAMFSETPAHETTGSEPLA